MVALMATEEKTAGLHLNCLLDDTGDGKQKVKRSLAETRKFP